MTWTFYDAQGREKRASSPPNLLEYAYRSGGWATAQSTAAATWKTLPIQSGVPYLTPVGAFTENADGSITVRDAGWYQVSACAVCISATTFAATLGPNNNAQNYYAQAGDNSTGASKDLSLGAAWYFNAGDKVYLTVYTTAAVAGANVQCRVFSITRVGAGPMGVQGPRGGKWWVSGVTYSGILVNVPADVVAPIQGDTFLYPDSGDTYSFDGSVWVYTGPLPVGGLQPSYPDFPPNPVDGQVVNFQDSTMRAAGCRWSFVYRAGGTAGGGLYKWEFIGGAPYQVSTDAVFSTAATAYAATAGPAFTLPFPGIYDIEIMGRVTTAAVAGNTAFLSYACGGTGANDNWSAIVSTPAAAVTTAGVTALARLTLTIAQLDLAAAMRSSAGSPGTVSSTFRRLRATPVALGYYA